LTAPTLSKLAFLFPSRFTTISRDLFLLSPILMLPGFVIPVVHRASIARSSLLKVLYFLEPSSPPTSPVGITPDCVFPPFSGALIFLPSTRPFFSFLFLLLLIGGWPMELDSVGPSVGGPARGTLSYRSFFFSKFGSSRSSKKGYLCAILSWGTL